MDYAASTPLDRAVLEAMRPLYAGTFGNPGSSHMYGQEASRAVFRARQAVAQALGADYRQVIFTGSATEANNLALRGAFECALETLDCGKAPLRVVISAVEHESVYGTCMDLKARYGAEIIEVPVDGQGIVDIRALETALNGNTAVVSVQMANSELGVVQPVTEISETVKNYKLKAESPIYPLLHTDAVQAFQYLPCDVCNLGVDMLTLSAHKICGPKGVGVLYVKNPDMLQPQITGGGQERGMRSGTENVAGIVGFAKAVEIAQKMRVKESKRVAGLRAALWNGIKKIVPDAEPNGSVMARIPNIVSVYFPGRPAQDVCIELDLMGVAVSPGTACSSRAAEPSRIIAALGFSGDRPSSSIRFSLGRGTTAAEVRAVLAILKKRFGK